MKHPTLSKYFSCIIRGSLSATTHLLLTMAIRLSPEEWVALSHEIKLPSYDHTIGYWEDLWISTFISLVKGLKHDHPFQIVSSQRLGLDLPGQWIQKPHPGQTPIHAEWTLWTCVVAGTRETPDPLSDQGEESRSYAQRYMSAFNTQWGEGIAQLFLKTGDFKKSLCKSLFFLKASWQFHSPGLLLQDPRAVPLQARRHPISQSLR